MNSKTWQKLPWLPLTLMAFMALTRFDHFGSALSLPDASLAVFFLAGTSTYGIKFFGLLLLEAGIIDYVAVNHLGVSDACITPAYGFLILSYLVIWLAGDYCKPFLRLNFVDTLKASALIVVATTCAYLISNGSYYVFSDYFGELTMDEFISQAVKFYPAYCSSSLIYIFISLGVAKLWQMSLGLFTVES